MRLSLKAAMGDNAVSIINHYQLLQYKGCLYDQWRVFCTFEVNLGWRILIKWNVFQYSWNANELYLFRANIAYALRQYYSQKNQTLDFTSVPSLVWKQIFFMLCFHLCLLCPFVEELFLLCTGRAENIQVYKETPRISFYMAATNPASPSMYIPKGDVEAAIRWGTKYGLQRAGFA